MNKKVLIPIIASVVTLLALLGVSYAYFTATIDGTDSDVTVVTATLGAVGYTTTTPAGTSVLPGWSGEGSTSVYLTSTSDKAVKYHCTVKLGAGSYTTNVYVQTTGGSDAQVSTMTPLTTTGVVVSEGILAAEEVASGSTGTAHNVTYNVIFNETGEAQNSDQEQTINVETTCELENNAYSNFQVLSGVMLDGNGNPIANQPMVMYSEPTYFTTGSNGEYQVTVEEGEHTIYFVPGMSMADLRSAGDTIKTNASAKSVSINTESMASSNITVTNYATYTVSVTCTNCTSDAASKSVNAGETATFTLTANSGYTLTGATATGGCTLTNGTLTLTNVSADSACSVTAPELSLVPVYWTTAQGGSGKTYSSTSKPTTTYDNLASLNLSQPGKFIRTTVLNDQVQGHEACLYYNNKTLCLGPNYFVSGDSDGTQTKTKLKAAMEAALGTTASSCDSTSSYAYCDFDSGYCEADSSGRVRCGDSAGACYVHTNGTAYCY